MGATSLPIPATSATATTTATITASTSTATAVHRHLLKLGGDVCLGLAQNSNQLACLLGVFGRKVSKGYALLTSALHEALSATGCNLVTRDLPLFGRYGECNPRSCWGNRSSVKSLDMLHAVTTRLTITYPTSLTSTRHHDENQDKCQHPNNQNHEMGEPHLECKDMGTKQTAS